MLEAGGDGEAIGVGVNTDGLQQRNFPGWDGRERTTKPGIFEELQLIDWLTGIMTILAMELVARRHWQGWAVGLANQVLWGVLIWQRELWGLAPLCLILSWRYSVALVRWKRCPAK